MEERRACDDGRPRTKDERSHAMQRGPSRPPVRVARALRSMVLAMRASADRSGLVDDRPGDGVFRVRRVAFRDEAPRR
jgi:hypothetical protein